MAITAAQVKELRERTGAGMMECKKILTETNGDIEAAITKMRESGLAKASKKAGRTAAEGTIVTANSDDGKTAVMIEINCETDFVGRDESFKAFAEHIAQAALANNVTELDALLTTSIGDKTVEEARQALIAKLGENIQVRRIKRVEAETVIGTYNHGGRIGVIAALTGGNEELAHDVAMHIAASQPEAISENDVSEDVLQKERDIFKAQAADSGKPADIIEKMIDGRMKKFLKEVSLTSQPFVKNPDQTVGDLLKAASAEVTAFTRFAVGEGIDKEEVDFATEVMSQVKGK